MGVETDSALAAAIGVKAQTVSGWMAKERSGVPLDKLATVADRSGHSIDWLLGRGDQRSQLAKSRLQVKQSDTLSHLESSVALRAADLSAPWALPPVRPDTTQTGGGTNDGARAGQHAVTVASSIRPLVLSIDHQPTGERVEYSVMPRFVGAVDAGGADGARGPGAGDDDIDLVGEIAFTFAWLRKRFAAGGGSLASIEVQGHGMAPALEDGDTVIIDTAATRVDRTGWYVIRLRGTRVIKHIKVRLDESLLASNDAFGRDTEVVESTEAERLQVVGRVVWPRILLAAV